MAQVNINDPRGPEVVETTPVATTSSAPAASSANTAVAGINFLTLIVVLGVAVVVLYFLFQFLAPMAR